MSQVFEHAYSAGMSKEDILECIAGMKPTPGVPQLIASLAAAGWEVVLLTDANSVFVSHWLKTHGLAVRGNAATVVDAFTFVLSASPMGILKRLTTNNISRQTKCY
ncbi:hypothetical protein EVAR_77563_1 [Eumeta japonica]|uniref:Uncharacterized protein n=1 Tax=Eumeta variegata TaxID=151549 RepID=A0A4C1T7P8_EUMVA|nr:hypothetical protein EVAR_77563_1 [Eumeta japonica]